MNSKDFLDETFTTIKHEYGNFPSQKKERIEEEDMTTLACNSKPTSIATLRKSA